MSVELQRRRFTVDEYYAMAEAGILSEGDRVELIEGEIIEMAAIGSRHAACVNRLTELLARQARGSAVVTVQNPVRLSDLTMFEASSPGDIQLCGTPSTRSLVCRRSFPSSMVYSCAGEVAVENASA